ncbi:hypothetical protein AB5J62_29820 [Amycolatopsis sp. cg5]|uniref:hypothetical protein n=1 Tax=Amycolatopsis sp. cg5 TaxID=3238802 RepID=UPI0035267B1F
MNRHQILPRHRTILVLDVEGSTTRTDMAKARLRASMYAILEDALRSSGIAAEHHDPPADRGDGALILIHPVDEAPKTLLLNRVIPRLAEQLAVQDPEHSFRLRVVLHAGEVNYDSQGVFGEALDIAFRLLDAPEVKRKLRTIESPLILVVSNDIYHSVIRHGYEGIDHESFEPTVKVRVAGARHRGWLHIPEPRRARERLGRLEPPATLTTNRG